MKKKLILLFILSGSMTAIQAQTKKNPPPPPPKPVKEIVKVTSPKIVDEKIEVKEPPVITIKGNGAYEFYKRNPSVVEISGHDNIITLKMKDGTTEKYNMSKKEEKKNFRDKYGKEPIPDPPPPPPPHKEVS